MDKKRILIVEDDKMLATIFKMYLESLGHELIGFYQDGHVGIDVAKVEKPDIVFMDINLKGEISGIDAAKTIINELKIPTVFLSGEERQENIDAAKATGANGYLKKPVSKELLDQTLNEIFN